MFDNLSEFWIALILIVAAAVAVVRWIIYKSTGKELAPGDSDILGNLRKKIVSGISTNIYLVELEKTDGRDAVRKEIENQINKYIESANMLTDTEKELLISLDKAKLINYIERELIKLGILEGE